MGRPGQSDEMSLQPQLVMEDFERWMLDFVGPLKPPSNQKTYILVTTDCVTKWVDAVALPRAMEETIINFLFELIVWYGLPMEVITDVGPQFVGHNITTTLRNHHITHRVTSPYHP